MNKPIIKSITLDIAGTTVKVTLQQTEELFDALAGILGRSTFKTSATPSISVYPAETAQPHISGTWIGPNPNGGTASAKHADNCTFHP